MGFRTGYRAGKLSEQQYQEVIDDITNYFQNASIGMTKDQYLEMCEVMGSQPAESEIPVDFSDLVLEVQECLKIYNSLQDNWDYMGGNYIGKNFNYIESIFRIYDIEPEMHKTYFELLVLVDNIRSKQIRDSKPKDKPAR